MKLEDAAIHPNNVSLIPEGVWNRPYEAKC